MVGVAADDQIDLHHCQIAGGWGFLRVRWRPVPPLAPSVGSTFPGVVAARPGLGHRSPGATLRTAALRFPFPIRASTIPSSTRHPIPSTDLALTTAFADQYAASNLHFFADHPTRCSFCIGIGVHFDKNPHRGP